MGSVECNQQRSETQGRKRENLHGDAMGLLSSDSTNDLYDGVDHIVEGVDVVVVEENLPDRLLVDSLLLVELIRLPHRY